MTPKHIPHELLAMIPVTLAAEYAILPLEISAASTGDRVLSVGFSGISVLKSPTLLDRLQEITDCRVKFVPVEEKLLHASIAHHYGIHAEVDAEYEEESFEDEEDSVVSLNVASWNRLAPWLRSMERLRHRA